MTLRYIGSKPKNYPTFIKPLELPIEDLVTPIHNPPFKEIKKTEENEKSRERIENLISGLPLTPLVSGEKEEREKEPEPGYIEIRKRYNLQPIEIKKRYKPQPTHQTA